MFGSRNLKKDYNKYITVLSEMAVEIKKKQKKLRQGKLSIKDFENSSKVSAKIKDLSNTPSQIV